jgi:hypothetical protein
MGERYTEVEFLDPDGDPDGDADAVHWLDEEEGLGPRSARLPARTTPHRVLGSLLVFALGFSVTGLFGASALRHDRAVRAAANELMLRATDDRDPVALTDPAQLRADSWRLEPTASIAVDVTNESPDPITLLPGATLLGPGLISPVTLAPAGVAVLAPGRSGRLTGVATAECGVRPLTEPAQPAAAVKGDSVLVQARTASGSIGVASLTVGAGEADPVRSRICAEEGDGLTASFFPESVDPATHSFTVAVSAHSLAAQPLRFSVTAGYADDRTELVGVEPSTLQVEMAGGEPATADLTASAVDALLPGARLTEATPAGAVTGVLTPGSSVSAGYTVHVTACPRTLPATGADVQLRMYLDYRGQPAMFQEDGFDLVTLVAATCGLIA